MVIEQDSSLITPDISSEGAGLEHQLDPQSILYSFKESALRVLRLSRDGGVPVTTIVDIDGSEHTVSVNKLGIDEAEEIENPRGWRLPIHIEGNETKIIVVTAASLILAGASIALTKYRKSKH